MNQKIKSRWVTALRSGKYDMGSHSLRYSILSNDGTHRKMFCCTLGVLYDLFVEAKQDRWRLRYDRFAYQSIRPMHYILESKYGAERIARWSGLDAMDLRRISAMNDTGFYTFEMMAAWINEEF